MADRRKTSPFKSPATARMALLIIGFSVVAACASREPVPDADLATARNAIEQAERGGAPEFAPSELDSARAKLQRAEQAVRDDDHRLAAQLAAEAEIDARLARRTAEAERAEEAAEAARRGLEEPTYPLRLNEPADVTPYR